MLQALSQSYDELDAASLQGALTAEALEAVLDGGDRQQQREGAFRSHEESNGVLAEPMEA